MSNITEIARRARVSRTTVSRVLNNHPYVKQDKREAVLKAMQDLNYVPNLNAVNLSRGKTNVIGVIVPTINHPFFSNLIEGIGRGCYKHHYRMLVHQSNYDPGHEIEFFNMLKYKLIDGLILGSSMLSGPVLDELSHYGSVVSCEASGSRLITKVLVNHESGIRMAVEHLRSKGHRRIGLCIGNPASGIGISRKKAFSALLEAYGLEWRDDWYYEGKYSIEDGSAVAASIAGQSLAPSAMVVGSDYVAAGLIKEAARQGIKVPEELAVIGFDNQPIAQVMDLTTIQQPIVQMGETAAAALHLMLTEAERPSDQTLELELIVRQST
ncbi:LacI family DNA-binding transcriptional regulator [Paenibacillus sambharensis]|uniref:LacI family DNA-binding transcriptional regulator n=1 Tax=Paenibacillus sambharensis TaxID=1803190 RepID=A0A2W1LM54_9BACL|nr:LacI family DNA-binding transcriptional regulator [Paenibacillus sambharensis]PZD95564.1 LacI family DNA-binding transcriptional regulator [Paenibacillus sambharensis]